jgi:hypothetical protein
VDIGGFCGHINIIDTFAAQFEKEASTKYGIVDVNSLMIQGNQMDLMVDNSSLIQNQTNSSSKKLIEMTPISKRVKPKQIKNSSIVPITAEK